jgi:hypothetical protein
VLVSSDGRGGPRTASRVVDPALLHLRVAEVDPAVEADELVEEATGVACDRNDRSGAWTSPKEQCAGVNELDPPRVGTTDVAHDAPRNHALPPGLVGVGEAAVPSR